MKAKLEFDLPEEQNEFNLVTNAGVLASTICYIDNRMRNELKYGITFEDQSEVCEWVRAELAEAMEHVN